VLSWAIADVKNLVLTYDHEDVYILSRDDIDGICDEYGIQVETTVDSIKVDVAGGMSFMMGDTWYRIIE
jgi:hypothetical protein